MDPRDRVRHVEALATGNGRAAWSILEERSNGGEYERIDLELLEIAKGAQP